MLRVAERVRRGTAPAEHAALRDTYRHDATSRNITRPGGELALLAHLESTDDDGRRGAI